jgi:tRNA threonylcarbamoyladenosine biosynthesis protein TsaB
MAAQHADAIAGFALGGASCGVGLGVLRAFSAPEVDAISERSSLGQSQQALVLLQALMTGRGRSPQQLKAVAFDAGPGSFTGLRIGCALAQGLALAQNLPVVPVPSGAALAWTLARQRPAQPLRVITLQDARMGEVYGSLLELECSPRGIPAYLNSLAQPWVCPPELSADRLKEALSGVDSSERSLLIAGDALRAHPDLHASLACAGLEPYRWDESALSVGAAAVVELAAWYLERGLSVSAGDAAPIYIRDKVALDVDEQRALRRQRREG